MKLIFEKEDFIQDTGFFGIGLLKAKGQDFNAGFLNIRGESVRRAVCPDADFLADEDSSRISEAIKDSLSDVTNDALELDELTLLAEIGAALIPGIGGEKGAVGSYDIEGEEA